jgi:hypothetical protein
MLGPLPYFHRVAVVLAVLMTSVGSGAWIAYFTPLPVVAGAGALVGLLAGLAVAYALVHVGHQAQPARAHRR